MEDYKKPLILFSVVVVIVVIILTFISKKETSKEVVVDGEVEQELHVAQIYFKNIQMLDDLPIDQSLLIQDEIMYYFVEYKKDVYEVELIDGSLEKLGDFKYKFKVKYEGGTLEVFVDKDKISIN